MTVATPTARGRPAGRGGPRQRGPQQPQPQPQQVPIAPPPMAQATSHPTNATQPIPRPAPRPFNPADHPIALLTRNTRRNYNITHALHARTQRRLTAMEIAFQTRLRELQMNQTLLEERLTAQSRIAHNDLKEMEKRVVGVLNEVKLELLGKKGGEKKVERTKEDLQMQFDTLRRQLVCQHHRGEVGEAQLPAKKVVLGKVDSEDSEGDVGQETVRVEGQGHSGGRDQNTKPSNGHEGKGSGKVLVETGSTDDGSDQVLAETGSKEKTGVQVPSSKDKGKGKIADANQRNPTNEPDTKQASTNSESDSGNDQDDVQVPNSQDAQFQADAASLDNLLRLLIAPPANDPVRFLLFVKSVEELLAQTPFDLLKIRIIRRARDMCIGKASEWWEDRVEPRLWKSVGGEGEDSQEDDEIESNSKGGEASEDGKGGLSGETGKGRQDDEAGKKGTNERKGKAGEPSKDDTNGKGRDDGQARKVGKTSKKSSNVKDTKDVKDAQSAPTGVAKQVKAQDVPKPNQPAPTKRTTAPPNVEKVLAKIGAFSGPNFDRWSRRVQAAWDANPDAKYRAQLLASLPHLLKGEPSRVVAQNDAFKTFASWEEWKTALFISLRPAT